MNVITILLLLISMRLLILLLFISPAAAQSLAAASIADARALDSLLQGYAYQAFTTRPKTGDVYDGDVPANLTGIQVSAMRLRSGSLRTRGVSKYKEFEIPRGVQVQPYVERLVLVYQDLGNWSMRYYPLHGYTYLAPVLGLLAYDAADLTATNLPPLDIQAAGGKPVSVRFSEVRPIPAGSVPKCVLLNLNGTVNLSNVLSGNVCTTFQQGHFAIAVESSAVTPVPSPTPPSPGLPRNPPSNNKSNSTTWITVGSVVGGFALLALLGLLVVWGSKYKKRKKMHQMERAADVGEALHMTSVGSTKAPAATGTRTQPMLETEYVP